MKYCYVVLNTITLTLDKLELWVTSLSDTPPLQYYDVETLEYKYISKLPRKKSNKSWIISPSKF